MHTVWATSMPLGEIWSRKHRGRLQSHATRAFCCVLGLTLRFASWSALHTAMLLVRNYQSRGFDSCVLRKASDSQAVHTCAYAGNNVFRIAWKALLPVPEHSLVHRKEHEAAQESQTVITDWIMQPKVLCYFCCKRRRLYLRQLRLEHLLREGVLSLVAFSWIQRRGFTIGKRVCPR